MDYTARKVEAVNESDKVWYNGMLMTRAEAKEMRESNE